MDRARLDLDEAEEVGAVRGARLLPVEAANVAESESVAVVALDDEVAHHVDERAQRGRHVECEEVAPRLDGQALRLEDEAFLGALDVVDERRDQAGDVLADLRDLVVVDVNAQLDARLGCGGRAQGRVGAVVESELVVHVVVESVGHGRQVG